MTNGSLIKVKSIAECSPCIIFSPSYYKWNLLPLYLHSKENKSYIRVMLGYTISNLLPSLEADTCNELWEASSFMEVNRLFHIFALRKVLKATQQFSKCLNEIDLIMYVYDDDTSDHTNAVYTENMAYHSKIPKS